MRNVLMMCVCTAAIVFASPAAAQDFKVIANASVPVTSMSAKDLSALFLKKVTSFTKWGSALKAAPVDLASGSDVRETFTKAVHGKAVSAVKAYWQQQIFSGNGTPPAELSSDAEVIATVARTPGSIGYVSSEAALPAGVKQLRIDR